MLLENDEFILREPRLSDVPAILKGLDKKAFQFIPLPEPYTKKSAMNWIKKTRKENRKGESCQLLIELKKNRRVAGGIGLSHISKTHRKAEMGYVTYRGFRGQGIARRAGKLVLDYGFHKLKLHKIWLWINTQNHSSKRVAAKLGFKSEAILKKDLFRHGKFHDMHYYSQFTKDWKKRKK